VLYVRGLKPNVTADALTDKFSPYGTVTSVKTIKDYAFIHFDKREDAIQV